MHCNLVLTFFSCVLVLPLYLRRTDRISTFKKLDKFYLKTCQLATFANFFLKPTKLMIIVLKTFKVFWEKTEQKNARFEYLFKNFYKEVIYYR